MSENEKIALEIITSLRIGTQAEVIQPIVEALEAKDRKYAELQAENERLIGSFDTAEAQHGLEVSALEAELKETKADYVKMYDKRLLADERVEEMITENLVLKRQIEVLRRIIAVAKPWIDRCPDDGLLAQKQVLLEDVEEALKGAPRKIQFCGRLDHLVGCGCHLEPKPSCEHDKGEKWNFGNDSYLKALTPNCPFCKPKPSQDSV